MKPSEQKQLAEKVAKFFDAEIDPDYGMGADHWSFPVAWKNKNIGLAWPATTGVINIDQWKSYLFDDTRIAPILMHLGKREMEKRGFAWKTDSRRKGYWAQMDKALEPYQKGEINKNEFIAFWKAVEQTGEMDERTI